MRLIKLHIENFGVLSDVDLSFENGLNTFMWDNGAGKSTLAAFIKVMLYGFEGDATRASYKEREVYRPWQGGVYGGSITFETEGKGYVAYKTFGKTRSGDVFKLIDTKTNLASLDYSEKLGEEIFLLDRESYLKSVFISQNDCAGKLTDRIRARLSNLTQVSGDVEQSEKAIKELESFLLKHSFNRKGSRGHELVSELTELNVELAKYRNIDENYDNTLGELDDYKNRQAWILEDTNQSNFLYGQMEGLKLTDEETERFEALRNKHVDELSINEIDALISTKAGKNRKRKLVFAALECLGVVMIIAAIGVILADIVPVGITLAVLGAVSFIVGIFLGRTGSEDTFLSALKTEREEYERLESKYLQFASAKDKYDSALKHSKNLSYEECTGKIGSLSRDLDLMSEKMRRRDELLRDVDRLTEDIEELKRKNRIAELTRDILSESKESFTNRYKDDVFEYFTEFVKMMGHTAIFAMNSQMQVLKQEGGLPREVDTQSMGIKDLYGIALRLSFAEAMFTVEKSFLIMDDPFVNFDDVRYEAAAAFLKKLAEEYQIIYFTCTKNRTV